MAGETIRKPWVLRRTASTLIIEKDGAKFLSTTSVTPSKVREMEKMVNDLNAMALIKQ